MQFLYGFWLISIMVLFLGSDFLCPLHQMIQRENEDLGYGFSRRGGQIYLNGLSIVEASSKDIDEFARAVGHSLKPCKGVDASTFVALNKKYAKDKNKAYYKWVSPGRFWIVELEGAKPSTFTAVDLELARDDTRVWRGDNVVEGADAATVKPIHSPSVWKDRHSVYYHKDKIVGADPDTFSHIGQGFYRDKDRVYWSSHSLPSADRDSFKVIRDDLPYARDRQRVWAGDTVLEGVQADSFELIHDHVFKDAKRVYVSTEAVEILGADARSFGKLVSIRDGKSILLKDRYRYYLYNPSYQEVYSIEPRGDVISISKPVWIRIRTQGKPVLGGIVSAQMKDGVLSEPQLTIQPDFKDEKLPTGEIGKMKENMPDFLEALTYIRK